MLVCTIHFDDDNGDDDNPFARPTTTTNSCNDSIFYLSTKSTNLWK